MTNSVEGFIKLAEPRGLAYDSHGSGADSVQLMLCSVNRGCESHTERGFDSLSLELERSARDTSGMLTFFHNVVSREDFDIAFQPIVDLASRDIHHFEALARFETDVIHSPYEMITFAERTGLIFDFDLAMCRRVLAALEDANRSGTHPTLAANLSGLSLGNPAFVEALHQLLGRHPAISSQLMFEITESAAIRDLAQANEVIQGLRDAGHQVCLDDFGAGASALKYLHALEVDIVKIDGGYIRSAMATKRNRAFLEAVVGLCANLGVETIAEMVQDRRCADLVQDCGVDYAQGYFFGRPSRHLDTFANKLERSVLPHRIAC